MLKVAKDNGYHDLVKRHSQPLSSIEAVTSAMSTTSSTVRDRLRKKLEQRKQVKAEEEERLKQHAVSDDSKPSAGDDLDQQIAEFDLIDNPDDKKGVVERVGEEGRRKKGKKGEKK